MKKTILILGSTGFIGKNLSEFLVEDYQLLTPKHKELDLLDSNALDRYFEKHKIDVIINCVVVGGSRAEEYENNSLKKNLLILSNILRNEKYYSKLIHLGSGAEYDKSRPIQKIIESQFGIYVPSDDYGIFKYIAAQLLERRKKAVNLRIFGLFGKYEDYRYRFISNAIVNNLNGRPISIRQNVYFDYVYIDDFVKIIKYFIENDTKESVYNIGTGRKIDISLIADKINEIAEKKSQIVIEKEGLRNEYTCDNSRLIRDTSIDFTDFDKSLKELYLWYKQKENIINLDSNLI